MDREWYDARGPAADGTLGTRYPDHEEHQERRQERREERRDRREDRDEDATEDREDWQEYAEDDYEERGDDYGGYYGDPEVYWTLPCQPNVIAMGGAIYYVCDSTWFIRAYSDGDVVYTEVPSPTGHE